MGKLSPKIWAVSAIVIGVLSQGACATTPTSQNPASRVGDGVGSVDPMTTGSGSGRSENAFAAQMGIPSAVKSREQVAVIARRADTKPLGTPENPVRANQPPGQRAYIARLRCSDGTAPEIKNRYNIGVGIYGNIVDTYVVSCSGGRDQSISLDMYHDWVENRAVSGFTIVPLGQPTT